MENGWAAFLDILNLDPAFRLRAKLEVSLTTELELPEEPFIEMLVELVKELYEEEESFQIGWFKRTKDNPDASNLVSKEVKFKDRKIIRNLWGRFAGEYFVFLPNSFDTTSLSAGDVEETIGLIFSQRKSLLMKTPDGYEILYLYMVE
ncbi:hypothetical protein [Planococcus soli]|uniref:hypothetical protein n=1 Tax=Planococcus soli TaxID=2666072 RepID=UPI00115E7FC2|nr:hypothetical protein [Planococcus soli]